MSSSPSGARACAPYLRVSHSRPRCVRRVEKTQASCRYIREVVFEQLSNRNLRDKRPRCCHTLSNTQSSPAPIKPLQLQPLPEALSTDTRVDGHQMCLLEEVYIVLSYFILDCKFSYQLLVDILLLFIIKVRDQNKLLMLHDSCTICATETIYIHFYIDLQSKESM